MVLLACAPPPHVNPLYLPPLLGARPRPSSDFFVAHFNFTGLLIASFSTLDTVGLLNTTVYSCWDRVGHTLCFLNKWRSALKRVVNFVKHRVQENAGGRKESELSISGTTGIDKMTRPCSQNVTSCAWKVHSNGEITCHKSNIDISWSVFCRADTGGDSWSKQRHWENLGWGPRGVSQDVRGE
jgi:hypothetical protein